MYASQGVPEHNAQANYQGVPEHNAQANGQGAPEHNVLYSL